MSVADLIVRLRLQAEELKSGLQGVQQNIRNWSNDIESVGQGMTKWITAPVVGLAGGLIKTGVEFKAFKQEAQAAFSVLLGSKDLADKFMDDVLQFARTTPFAFPDLLDGTRKMVAFGMEADTSLLVIDAIANAVAAMGGGAAEIDTLSDVFAKITSNGRMTMMEVNRLGDQGINALKILANQYGVTVEEMSKMISAGAVDGETAIQYLVDGIMNGTEGVAGATVAMAGSLEKIKGTWKGTMDSLKGAWRNAADEILTDEVFEKIGETVWKLIEVIKKLPELMGPTVETLVLFFEKIVDGISNLVDWFFGLSPAMQQTIIKFGLWLVAAGPLLIIIGQIGIGVSTLIGILPGLVGAITAVNTAWGVAAAGTGGVATFGAKLAWLAGTGGPIALAVISLGLLIDWVKKTEKAWENMLEVSSVTWDEMGNMLDSETGRQLSTYESFAYTMQGMNIKLGDTIYSTTSSSMKATADAVKGYMGEIRASVEYEARLAAEAMNKYMNMIMQQARQMTAEVRAAFSDVNASGGNYKPPGQQTINNGPPSWINMFDSGGIVPGPIGKAQLAIVHGGETILPTHKTGGTVSGHINNI